MAGRLQTVVWNSADGGGDTIKVGEFASLTGSEAAFGRSSDNGTKLAVEQINAAGGVLGKQLELITEDDQSKDGESATAVKTNFHISQRRGGGRFLAKLLSHPFAGEAAPICQEYKIPANFASSASTNPKVTQIGDYIFRVCFIDPFQGTVMANFALKTLNVKHVALMTDVGSTYSVGLADFFKKRHSQPMVPGCGIIVR